MALIATCHSRHVIQPSVFDPFAKAVKPAPVEIDVLKDVFIKGQMPKEAER